MRLGDATTRRVARKASPRSLRCRPAGARAAITRRFSQTSRNGSWEKKMRLNRNPMEHPFRPKARVHNAHRTSLALVAASSLAFVALAALAMFPGL